MAERASQVIGQSGAFLDALELASRAAALDRPVLVIGERGTGKELVAERLHRDFAIEHATIQTEREACDDKPSLHP